MMKIKNGFRMRTLGRESIIVGEGIERINFNKMIALNSSAAYLWESVEGKDFSVQDLADLLMAKYEVDPAVALADSQKIAADWLEVGIVEE